VVRRRGGSSLGCLFSLLVTSAVVYFGVGIGETWWRYFQFQDTMRQEVRLARHYTDDAIARRLRSLADSLGLPEAAGRVTVRRGRGQIQIESVYYEQVELPLMVREVRFHPRAQGTY
jgi:hypothetical protein